MVKVDDYEKGNEELWCEMMMKRMLFDSSVYGRLVEDSELIGMLLKQIPEKFVVYGSETIRRELRDTPKYVRHEGKNLRIFLLNIYSSVTREHELRLNKLVKILSSDYFVEYVKQGGARSNEKMRDDFLIIATAAIYNLDIVISDDEKTMFSESSIKAYRIVNKKYGLQNPVFLTYRRFKAYLKSQEDLPV